MEKGKHHVDTEKRIVTFGHVTKTIDGTIELTTTFNFSKVKLDRLLKRAADAELIAWRAKSGIKNLSTTEAAATLQNAVIDCSKIVERVKHVETADEKALKTLIKEGKMSVKDILAAIAARKAAQVETESAQDAMEDGEETGEDA